MHQENTLLRKALADLKIENARLLAREQKSIVLIKDLIANALDATFKAADAATLLKGCAQNMTALSAEACLISWAYQTDNNPVTPTPQVRTPARIAKLTLVKSLKRFQKVRTLPF